MKFINSRSSFLNKFIIFWVIVEVVIAFLFIDKFGFLSFILEVIISGVIGAVFVLRAGLFKFFARTSFLSLGDIFGAFGISLGGSLLFLPGIIGDIAGISIIIISFFMQNNARNNAKNNTNNFTQNFTDFNDENSQRARYKGDDSEDEIIDVEIIK